MSSGEVAYAVAPDKDTFLDWYVNTWLGIEDNIGVEYIQNWTALLILPEGTTLYVIKPIEDNRQWRSKGSYIDHKKFKIKEV